MMTFYRRCGPRSPVPIDGLPESLPEVGPGPESEFPKCPARIQHPPRLAVWFGRVPDDTAPEARQLHNEADQFPDGDLESGADVDRFGPVVVFRREADRLRGVLHVKEFPG